MSTWRWLRGAAIAVGILLIVGVGAYERHFGCGIPPGCASRRAAPLTLGEPVRSSLSGLHPQRRFSFTLARPTAVTVGVDGEFDTYLELHRAGGDRPIAEDDDGGVGLNSRIVRDLQPGGYVVVVRGFQRAARGDFTLTVAEGVEPTNAPGSETQVLEQVLAGSVASVSGRTDLAAGAPCTVTVRPESGEYNCRVWVVCGGQTIYGGGQAGYNRCMVQPGATPQSVTAHDRGETAGDGDPRLDLETAAGTAAVSDSGPRGAWTVAVRLAPPPPPPPS